MSRKKKPLIERFETKYRINNKTQCWEWIGAFYGSGYGNIMLENGKITGSHRASWLIHKGKIPLNHNICHKCDNKKCVNPEHLFIGTQKDNLHDMSKKGRRRSNTPIGIHNINAKLVDEKVREIRNKYVPYIYTLQMLADEYNVSKRLIYMVISNKIWKHV